MANTKQIAVPSAPKNAAPLTIEQVAPDGFIDIKLIAKDCETKSGKHFLNFKTIKNGHYVDFRFTNDSVGKPTKEGKYYATICIQDLNFDKNREYPCYWYRGELLNVQEVTKTGKVIDVNDLPTE